jgi:predicted NBD/HSP70 family sugar kinase
MARKKTNIRFFRTQPDNEKTQFSLKVLNLLKQEQPVSIDALGKKAGAADRAAEYINSCVKKDLLKISGSGKDGPVKFNTSFRDILGVGFNAHECILTVMNLGGKVLEKELLDIGLLVKLKGRNKEIKEIASEIAGRTRLKDRDLSCAGLAIPQTLKEKNLKSQDILAEGIAHAFGCDVFITGEATAAGYAEKDLGKGMQDKDTLYMHSDIGTGVVIKGEMIFEADETSGEGNSAYLRSWDQFSVVATAKSLVNKGLGTDIVNMVNGDVDAITLGVVFDAAEKKDELAEDLLKRSGLALGVRVAYLVNMFNVDTVILGGGTEKKEGEFISYVKESSARFLLKDRANKLKIVPCALDKEASSVGAASLCRRELFMEG